MLLWTGWLLVTVSSSACQGHHPPLLLGGRRPRRGGHGRHRPVRPVGARAQHGARDSSRPGPGGHGGVVLRPVGPGPVWIPWLVPLVLIVGLGCAVFLALAPRLRGRAALALGAVGICAALAGPGAYALDTAATAYTGAIPSAGPASAGSGPGGAPGAPGGFGAGPPGAVRGGISGRAGLGAPGTGGVGAPAPGPVPPRAGRVAPAGSAGLRAPGRRRVGRVRVRPGRQGVARGPGGGGGFLSISTPGSKLVHALESGAARYTWVAATVNSNSAAGYQLATDDPVMAIGGFNGTDPLRPWPSSSADVAAKKGGLLPPRVAAGFGARAARARRRRRRSPSGWRATSRPRPSTASPSTTSRRGQWQGRDRRPPIGRRDHGRDQAWPSC